MTTNNDDTQNEVSGITLKDSKNNGLSVKNEVSGITPNHAQTNSDDTNLTEQWKKGELKAGMYYIKHKGSGKLDWWHGYYWEDSWSENVEEVIAPVPSYEEWRSTGKFAMEAMKVAEENQQLKELLNYIRDEIADMPVYAKQMGFGWISEAAYRIDNLIGEKK